MITFGSLFAGIGGFDLGFERAGMVCKWQVEIDSYATKILERHWPNVHRERDIKQSGSRNLTRVDIICGGFPCQDISYAGAGAGLDGERSGLFFEAIRVVRELRPQALVLENVAGLLTRGLDRVLGTLAEIGFDAEWHCIPAAAVGAPHIRDRVFILGYANSGLCDRKDDQTQTGWPILELSSEVSNTNGGRQQELTKRNSQQEIGIKTQQRCDANGPGVGSGCENDKRKRTAWEIEPNVGRVAHGVSNRVDRLRGLGNAIVPQVAEVIGRHVIKRLQNKVNPS